MPNVIIGLKYHFDIPNKKIEMEEQLMEVFADLKQQYSILSPNFKITTCSGEAIKDFEYFLQVIIKEKQSVILNGSGDIGGLIVKDAKIEYDLSLIGSLTYDWDYQVGKEGSCYGCRNYIWELYTENEGNMVCTQEIKKTPTRDNCPKYHPNIKNSKGKCARKLDELVAEAIK